MQPVFRTLLFLIPSLFCLASLASGSAGEPSTEKLDLPKCEKFQKQAGGDPRVCTSHPELFRNVPNLWKAETSEGTRFTASLNLPRCQEFQAEAGGKPEVCTSHPEAFFSVPSLWDIGR